MEMSAEPFFPNHLLSTRDLSRAQIETILETASKFKDINKRPIKKVPTLRGRTIVFMFLEPSTRTKTSFELAAKRLSADSVSFSTSGSSISKGETLVDTARNLQALNPDIIVLRDKHCGTGYLLSRHLNCSVINAGDGINQHPTQSLLDALTIKDRLGQIDGLNICIIGDILSSRVARSNLFTLRALGAKVTVCAPKNMLPAGISEISDRVEHNLDKAIDGQDVIMLLRVQNERHKDILMPTRDEYHKAYGFTVERFEKCLDHTIVMHPGPVNHWVEVEPELLYHERCTVMEQVENGIATRMAVLYLFLGGVFE